MSIRIPDVNNIRVEYIWNIYLVHGYAFRIGVICLIGVHIKTQYLFFLERGDADVLL
jgi:hypothetical protein